MPSCDAVEVEAPRGPRDRRAETDAQTPRQQGETEARDHGGAVLREETDSPESTHRGLASQSVRLERHILQELVSNSLFAAAALYFIAGVILSIQVYFAKDLPMISAVTAAPILLYSRSELLTPCAFLTGVVFTYGRLGAELEYMATQACGVHPLRVVAPVALLGLTLTGIQWWSASYAIPDLLVRSDRLTQKLTKEVLTRFEPGRNEFEVPQAGFYMSWQKRKGLAFEDVVIDARGQVDGSTTSAPEGTVRGRAKRVEVSFEPQVLRLWIYGLQTPQRGSQLRVEKLSLALRLDKLGQSSTFVAKPEYFTSDALFTAALRRGTLGRIPTEPEDREGSIARSKDRAQAHHFFYAFHRRAAWAFASLVLGLVGAPVALFFRRGTRLGGLVVAFGIFLLVYFPLARIGGEGLSAKESVPFWVSAWMATAVSSVVALVLLARLARR